MYGVIETPTFIRAAQEAGLSGDEVQHIVTVIANDPTTGVLIKAAGGARKVRFAGRGKGKSGGYRVITYYAADDVPVFLLEVYGKGEKGGPEPGRAEPIESNPRPDRRRMA